MSVQIGVQFTCDARKVQVSYVNPCDRHNHWSYCAVHQTTNDAYHGNWAKIHIDRGHLNPNEVNNHDPDAQDATFTMTNVAPQYSRFNEFAWREYECLVREYIENYNTNQTHYALTGTLGEHGWMEGENGQRVKIPAYYWKTVCYKDEKSSWAVAIVAPNLNTEDTTTEKSFMSINQFSQKFLNDTKIYGTQCQNAGLGPWKAVVDNLSEWKNKLNCNFALETNTNNRL